MNWRYGKYWRGTHTCTFCGLLVWNFWSRVCACIMFVSCLMYPCMSVIHVHRYFQSTCDILSRGDSMLIKASYCVHRLISLSWCGWDVWQCDENLWSLLSNGGIEVIAPDCAFRASSLKKKLSNCEEILLYRNSRLHFNMPHSHIVLLHAALFVLLSTHVKHLNECYE